MLPWYCDSKALANEFHSGAMFTLVWSLMVVCKLSYVVNADLAQLLVPSQSDSSAILMKNRGAEKSHVHSRRAAATLHLRSVGGRF